MDFVNLLNIVEKDPADISQRRVRAVNIDVFLRLAISCADTDHVALGGDDVVNAGSLRAGGIQLTENGGIGLDRLIAFPTRWSPTLEAQAAFATDCRAAGISLSAPLEPVRA